MFAALSASAFAQWVTITGWAYASLLTAHGLGMAALVGLTVMVSVRILGFPKQVPLATYVKTIPFGIGAFIINASSGTALFIADADSLVHNPSFLAKIGALVIGLIILRLMYRGPLKMAVQQAMAGNGEYRPTSYDKTLAVLAILVWLLAVIVSGRLIAYLSKDGM